MADLAVNARGDAAVALFGCESARKTCGRSALYLVPRRAGRRFGSPIRITARGGLTAAAVAINARGDVLVSYDRERTVYARVRTEHGRLRGAQRLGRSNASPFFSAALGADRRAVVAWASQDGEGFARARLSVAVAPSGKTFARRKELARFESGEVGPITGQQPDIHPVDVAIASGRRTLVAFMGLSNGHVVVRVADVAGRRVSAPQTVSPETMNAELGDLEIGPNGEALLMWVARPPGQNGPDQVMAATRPETAPGFDPAEVVFASGDVNGAVLAAEAAFDPVTGRAVAVWRNLDLDGGPNTATREPVGP